MSFRLRQGGSQRRAALWIGWVAAAASLLFAFSLEQKLRKLNEELARQHEIVQQQAAANARAQQVLDILTAPTARRVLLTAERPSQNRRVAPSTSPRPVGWSSRRTTSHCLQRTRLTSYGSFLQTVAPPSPQAFSGLTHRAVQAWFCRHCPKAFRPRRLA